MGICTRTGGADPHRTPSTSTAPQLLHRNAGDIAPFQHESVKSGVAGMLAGGLAIGVSPDDDPLARITTLGGDADVGAVRSNMVVT